MLRRFTFLLLCALARLALSQYYLTVTPATTETNLATTYQFEITTSLAVVPAATVVRIAFPPQYTFASIGMLCTNVFWPGAPTALNCNYSGNFLTVSNGFPNDLSNQYLFQFNASAVVNPLPAGTTGSFVVSFLFANGTNDSSTGSYTVTITEGQAVCTRSLTNALVGAMGTLTIGFTPKNAINNGTVIGLAVTMARSYPNDTTNTDVTPSLPGSTVTGTYRFNLTLQPQFNLTMLMPFSTQPVSNFIKVTSYLPGGSVDSCYISIDGVTANNFTTVALSTSRVQTTATLSIGFINFSPIYPNDQLTLQLPSDFGLQNIGSTVSFVRGIIGTRNITVLNGVVTVWNVSTATLIKTNTTFLLSNVVFPSSTKQLPIVLSSQTNTGYLKDSTTVQFAAQMGTLSSLSIVCDTAELGYSPNCTFSLVLQSSLSANSYLTFAFPGDVSIAGGNYQCPTTGTQSVRSNCTNFFANNSISVTSLTNGSVAGGTPITVRLVLPLPNSPGNYSVNVSTWGSALIDTGMATLMVKSRLLLPAEFTASVASQVTYTSANYVFTLVVPATISTPTTAAITIPVDSQGVLSCNGGAVLSSFAKPLLTLGLSAISAGTTLVLNVSGLLTPISTQPIALSIQVISASNASIVYFYSNNLSLQVSQARLFQFVSASQTSYTVYSNTTLTVVVSGLQASDLLEITGGTFGAGCTAGSNITSLTCTAITNGVQLNITTDGLDASEARRYSLAVGMVAPSYIGSLPLTVSSYTTNRLYSQATGSISLAATSMNTLSVSLSQSAPYYRENDTYTFIVNATTPGCTQLSLTIPSSYLFVAAAGLSSCTFLQNDNNILTFSLDASQNIKLQVQLTNPDAFSSFYFKTSSNKGDMDSQLVLPVSPCSSACRSCTSDPNNCTSCYTWSSNNKLDNGNCLSTCPSGKYFNVSSCVACLPNCTNCTNSTNCFGCSGSMLLFNNSCLAVCPNGYYSSSNACIACPVICASCSSLTNCSVCATGYSLFNNTCLSSCPGATYPLNGVCYNCSDGCLNCTYLGCTVCNTTTLLYNGQCVSGCPSGLFVDPTTRVCTSCQSPCATCANTSSSCLSCITGRYLMAADCLATCPDNYYQNVAAGICSQCVSPCLLCSATTVCLSCVPGQYLYQSKCFTNCPSGSYASSTTTCSACVVPCLTCTSATACVTCSANLLLFNLTCLTTCPSFYYNSSGVCTSCVTPCLDCQGPAICLSCVTGALFNRSCVTMCPTNTYNNSGICTSCIAPCSLCQGTGTNCLACVTGYSLMNATCVSSCPVGYYSSNGSCLACVAPCVTCSSVSACLSCNRSSTSPYYSPTDSACVSVCSGGLHLNPTAFLCESCQVPCLTCLQSTQCLSCTSGFIFIGNNTCSTSCPSGQYNLSNNCVDCPSLCSTCQLKDSVVCLSCSGSALFFGNFCVASCPANTTAYYNHCVSSDCPVSNCIRCSSLNCLECSAYYKLNTDNNTCTFSFTPSTVVDNIKTGNIIPFPFFAAAVVAIIALAAIKSQFKDMYLPVSLHAAIGLLEVGAVGLWVYFSLLTYKFGEGVYAPLTVVLAALYLLSNLLNLLCYIPIRRDRKYSVWILDHKVSTIVVMCIATVVSFRFSRIQFSKLGGWELFSARLQTTAPFLAYNVLTIGSLGYLNLFAVVLCGLISYNQSTMNQLFFSSLEVVLMEVVVLAVALAQVIKPKNYLLEQQEDYIHGNDNDSVKVDSLKCLNEELQSASNLDAEQKNPLAEQFISEKESSNELQSEEIEFQVEEEAGDAASPDSNLNRSRLMDEQRRRLEHDRLVKQEQARLKNIREQEELARQEIDAQQQYEQVRRQFELAEEKEAAEKRNKSDLLRKYEQELQQKEEEERQLKQRLKHLEDEQEQESRAAMKQRRQWQLMDIQDHLSREREFRDALRQQQRASSASESIIHRATPSEERERKLAELRTLADLNMELYRESDPHSHRHSKKKKKKKPVDPTHQVLLHKDASISSNSSRSRSKRSHSPSLKDSKSKESFIVQFDEKEDISEKITKISQLNQARSNSPNLKTIEEEEARQHRQDDDRFDRLKINRMLEDAQKKASYYLNSITDHDQETVLCSDEAPRRIRHDASMPLPSGKMKMRSTRSYKEGIGSGNQEGDHVNPIQQEDEEAIRNQQIIYQHTHQIEDFRNSIEHSLTKRRDLQPQRMNVRARQSQAIQPTEKDLELERIYMQSIDRSPSQTNRKTLHRTTDESWNNSRRNTSPSGRRNRYD